MKNWEVWMCDPYGVRIKHLDELINLTIVRVANNIGAWKVNLPGDFDESLLKTDNIFEFWRRPEGGSLSNQMAGFYRKSRYYTDAAGLDFTELSGVDGNDLLRRRIVAYAAGSPQSTKTDNLDDMMKAVVRENLGVSGSASRNLTSLNFSVAPDFGDAPSMTRGFAWKPVLDVCKELAEASYATGTALYFNCVPNFVSDNEVGFEFRTYINQPGIDTTIQDGLVFGKEWGNMETPDYEFDRTNEQNYIYAGGQGEEADRVIVEVHQNVRIAKSPWNRCEGFADARNEETTGGVTAQALSALREGRTRIRFRGTLLDTPQSRYGIEWNWGDRIYATYRGMQFEAVVTVVQISVDSGGKETIDAQFEVVT